MLQEVGSSSTCNSPITKPAYGGAKLQKLQPHVAEQLRKTQEEQDFAVAVVLDLIFCLCVCLLIWMANLY